MAGIAAPAAKRALFTLLQAQTGTGGTLEGVKVSYSYEAKLHQANREYIYGGSTIRASGDLEAMQSAVRMKRTEAAPFTLHIRVKQPGDVSTESVEQRIAAIGAAVENIVAANPTLTNTVLKATVDGWSLDAFCNEEGAHAELDYTITFTTYLT